MRGALTLPWVLLSGLFFFFVTIGYAEEPLPKPIGKVIWVRGKLEAIAPNDQHRILTQNSFFYPQDTLKTEHLTEAEIAFTNQTILSMRADTQFYLKQYEYSRHVKSPSTDKFVIDLLFGGFRILTGPLAKTQANQYVINTPVATGLIQSGRSDFSIYVTDDNPARVWIVRRQGKVCLRNKKGTACTSTKNPYLYVYDDEMPIALAQKPDIFDQEEEITDVNFEPDAKGTNKDEIKSRVSGFCIQN